MAPAVAMTSFPKEVNKQPNVALNSNFSIHIILNNYRTAHVILSLAWTVCRFGYSKLGWTKLQIDELLLPMIKRLSMTEVLAIVWY